jgi:hypothetical protein
MPEPFDVFISHNSKDKPAVRKLAQELEWRRLKVWLDEEQLVPGESWRKGLEVGILASKTAAVLIGKDGLGPWEKPEMDLCLREAVENNKRVIPVLLPGAPGQPELLPFLKGYTWIDFRSGLNEEGLDRLEWGITGKKPSKIKHGHSDINTGKVDQLVEEKRPSPQAKPKDIVPYAFAAVNTKTPLQKAGTLPWPTNKWWLVLFGLGIIIGAIILENVFYPGMVGPENNIQIPVRDNSYSAENKLSSPTVTVRFEIDPPGAKLSITNTRDGNTKRCWDEPHCEIEAQFGDLLHWKAEKDKYQTLEDDWEVGVENPTPISLHKINN